MMYILLFIILVFNVVSINNMLDVLDRRREQVLYGEWLDLEQEYIDSIDID